MSSKTWRQRLTRIRQWALEDKANVGLGGPPNNWASSPWVGRDPHYSVSARFGNDAAELIFSDRDCENGRVHERVIWMVPTSTFRTLAFWYLRRWVFGEWFGLRRWLFFKWLHWDVARFKRRMEAQREARHD